MIGEKSMTPKELKRLSRSDLLEMLLDLSRENERLRAGNEHLSAQLTDRKLAIENCGSLAEAALQLNGIFQAADAACAQYTENILARSAELEERCQRMEQETIARCKKMEEETKQACDLLLAQAQAQAQSCLEEAMKQRDSQDQEYLWLTDLMNGRETE